ncbi:MAG: zinc ribbon domain-containing protein [Acidobacteriia bacterium]|nr:zinc ribbon domain-containing protein [Terriglobia bacterium]
MPLYEYKCKKCRKQTEKIENYSGPHLKKCPHCGGAVERTITAPAIQFKGSGWYVTDYAGKSGSRGDSGKAEKSGGGEAAEAKGKETAAKETKESKESKESKEKKTAKKK